MSCLVICITITSYLLPKSKIKKSRIKTKNKNQKRKIKGKENKNQVIIHNSDIIPSLRFLLQWQKVSRKEIILGSNKNYVILTFKIGLEHIKPLKSSHKCKRIKLGSILK